MSCSLLSYEFKGIVIYLSIVLIHLALQRRTQSAAVTETKENAETFFRHVLAKVALNRQEKKLLQTMAKGTRLRHPAMMLLGPDLLQWSQNVWLNERGPKVVTPDMKDRIKAISTKLFEEKPVKPSLKPVTTKPSEELIPVWRI